MISVVDMQDCSSYTFFIKKQFLIKNNIGTNLKFNKEVAKCNKGSYTAYAVELGDGTVTTQSDDGIISVNLSIPKSDGRFWKRCYNNPGTFVCGGIRCLFWKRV